MKTNTITRFALLLAIAPLATTAMSQEAETAKPKSTAMKEVVPAPGTIAAAVRDGATFSILSKAIKAAGLEETLGAKGTYTVFAPTDEAFEKLPAGTIDKLLLPENKEKLRSLVLYHVIPGQFLSSELKSGELKTANGEKVEIEVNSDKSVKLEDETKVAKADLVTTNGVVHSIDRVLVPKSLDGFAGLDED